MTTSGDPGDAIHGSRDHPPDRGLEMCGAKICAPCGLSGAQGIMLCPSTKILPIHIPFTAYFQIEYSVQPIEINSRNAYRGNVASRMYVHLFKRTVHLNLGRRYRVK